MTRNRLADWAGRGWFLWLAAVLSGVACLAWSLTAPSTAYALALDATAWRDQGTAQTTVTTAAFSTTSGNELLLAFVSADSASGPNTTVTRVSGAGLTWVLVRRTNVQLGTAEIWRAFAPAVLTNVTVTATLSQAVSSSLTVVSFTGVDPSGTNGSGAVGATGSGNAARGAPTASLTTTRNNSWVFGVGTDWDNPIARTPGANQSLVHQYMPPVGDTYWVQRLNATTPTAGTSVTLNDTAPTGDRYNLSLVEVLPALGPSYSITGTLGPAASGSGATVTLGGAASATTTAGANGTFSFSNLANGIYTVTPSKAGVTFSPANRTVTVTGANVTGVNFTAAAQTQSCPCTIWSPSSTPTVASATDTNAVELGVKFRANVNGSITGIRFYKGAANTGTHVGNLWTSTGTRLATATFTNEAASDWQQVTFASPVAITANTTYVASYHTNVGRYASDNNYFASAGVTRGPLTALANGVDGGNGVYRYGATSAFPNQTWQSNNYWVDVVFTTSGGGPDLIPPTVTGRTPASNAAGVNLTTAVTATFSEALDATTVTTTTVTLQGPGTNSVPATVSYNSATFTATLIPTSPLTAGTLYTATLKGGTTAPQIKDVAGNALTATASWSFTTAAVQTWSITGTLSPGASGSGATVTLSGAASATTTAGANGTFSFSNLANGIYTVTPSKAGVTFSPANRTVTVTGANVTGVSFTGQISTSANLTIDGSRTFQTMDGMGVNINVNNWNGGQFAPALDLLVDTHGSSVLRVVRDPMDWVSTESLIPALRNLDPATLQAVYEAPKMQDIWNTIAYLNQKGLGGNQIMLNFMGWTPTWLGGSGAYGQSSHITAGKEGAFATMVASLVYYGRTVRGLDFTLLGPMNEEDWNCLEGPCVSAGQYVTILKTLIAELDSMGLTDVRLVGPDTAGGPSTYISAMMADPTIRGRVDHLGMHSYSGGVTPGTSYPPRNYWLTERAAWCSTCDTGGTVPDEWGFAKVTNDYLLGDLSNGFSSVLVWEGHDSYWYHHNSWSYWGLLAYDQSTGVYTPRKRFYANAQLSRFIRPGSVRIAANSSISGLTVLAFSNPTNGQVTIVGHNTGSSAVTINGQLQNLPSLTSLALYQTNASLNMQRGADVSVIGGAFSVTVPADTFFSLTN